jgi:hypothetical protein
MDSELQDSRLKTQDSRFRNIKNFDNIILIIKIIKTLIIIYYYNDKSILHDK